MGDRKSLLERVTGRIRGGLLVIALFSIAINLLMLTGPLYMMQVYDRVLTTRSMETLIVLSLVVLAALVALSALDGVRQYLANRIGAWMERSLTEPLLGAGVLSGLRGDGGNAQGLRDLASIKGFVASPSIFPLFDAPFAPFFLAVLYVIHPIVAYISLGGMIFLFLLGVVNDLVTRPLSQKANAVSSAGLNRADAMIRNADSITAMGMLKPVSDRFTQMSEDGRALGGRSADLGSLMGAVAKGARLILQSAILGVSAWLVLQNEMSPGSMIACSVIMGRALAPVEQAIGTWRGLVAARAAFGRVKALLGAAENQIDTTELPQPTGKLSVEKLTYLPAPGAKPILNQVSFTLEPGESLGVIGPSGAGKSTLSRMLVGSLSPSRGVVRLDGADIRQMDEAGRRHHIGYLPQDIELFPGTVKENVGRMTEAEDGPVIEAARRSHAHDVILGLPEGYATKIGTGGHRLSGGQRQRIGLARALFGDPKLIVLDEPNSNLDNVGEQAFHATLQQCAEERRTIIVVSHRPGILRGVDKILILAAGKVQDFGPRDAVLQRLNGGGEARVATAPGPTAANAPGLAARKPMEPASHG